MLDRERNKKRLKIFQDICLPSIKSQSNQNFVWRLFVDIRSEDYIKQTLQKILPSNAKIIWVSNEYRWWYASSNELNLLDTAAIVTSQLDNDDALAKDYVAKLQDTVNKYLNQYPDIDKVIFNAPRGLELDYHTGEQRIRSRSMEPDFRRYVSPFVSLYEKTKPFISIYGEEHRKRIDTNIPIIDINSHSPLYTRCIHGGNISNGMEWNFIIKPAHAKTRVHTRHYLKK